MYKAFLIKYAEIAIKGKNKIDVTLSDDTKALDEVVVIGYGTAKRKDITGSVATVSSEVLSAVPVASATEALQGKMLVRISLINMMDHFFC